MVMGLVLAVDCGARGPELFRPPEKTDSVLWVGMDYHSVGWVMERDWGGAWGGWLGSWGALVGGIGSGQGIGNGEWAGNWEWGGGVARLMGSE